MALIQLEPRAFVCTPSSLLASVPCLDCLSEKELLAAILSIFITQGQAESKTVLEASACFTCMSKKQMLQALTTLLGNALLGESYDPADLLERFKCLRCSSEKQLLAAILYLLCGYLND